MATKQFKDFQIADFTDVGSLTKHEINASRHTFFGFNRVKDNTLGRAIHAVSNLADVL